MKVEVDEWMILIEYTGIPLYWTIITEKYMLIAGPVLCPNESFWKEVTGAGMIGISMIRWMEEILHQLIGGLSHYL